MNIREEWSPEQNLFELVKTGNGGTLNFTQDKVNYGVPAAIEPSTNNGFNTAMSFTGKPGSGVNGQYAFQYGRLATFTPAGSYEVGYLADQGLPDLLTSLHRDYNVYLGEITLVDTSQVTFSTSDSTRQNFTFQIADTSLMYAPGIYNGKAYFKGSLYGPEVFSYIKFANNQGNNTFDEVNAREWNAIDCVIEEDSNNPGRFYWHSNGGPTATLQTTNVADFPSTGSVTVDILVEPKFAVNEQCIFSFIESGNTLMTGLFTDANGMFSLYAEGQVVFSGISPSGWFNETQRLITVQRGESGWSFWLDGFHLITVESPLIFARPQSPNQGSTFQYGNCMGYQPENPISMYGKIFRAMIRTTEAYTPGQNFDPATQGPFNDGGTQDLSALYPNTALGTLQSAMFS